MRILFISDFNLKQNSGGAQISNQIIINKGLEIGHEIIHHDYDSSYIDLLRSYDIIISSNLEYIYQKNPEKLDYILKHPFHVRLEHDSCSYLPNELRKLLFNSSKINFFLSSFHIEFFRKLYGDYFNNVKIVYDPIDTSIFFDSKQNKIYDIVYCGFIHPLKGIDKLIDFSKKNPNRKISIFGWSYNHSDKELKDYFDKYENINFFGKKNQKEISEIFQKSKAVFHAPVVNEPFCRMIAEAIICGCQEIIGETDKIGSYLEYKNVGYDKFKTRCENAAEIFWRELS